MKKIKGFIDPISIAIALVVAVSAAMTTINQKDVASQQQLTAQSQVRQALVVAE